MATSNIWRLMISRIFGHHGTAPVVRLAAVNDDGQGIDLLAVEQNVHLDHVRGAVLLELVVHRGIATADRFELVEEVEHDLAQRQLVSEHDLAAVVGHVDLHAALLVGQRHHRADVVLRHVQVDGDDGFAHFLQCVPWSGILEGFSTMIDFAIAP